MTTLWRKTSKTASRFAALAVIGAMACAATTMPDTAWAGEQYRYKDPFGISRAMTVPKGYAKYYKRALLRTQYRASGTPARAQALPKDAPACDACPPAQAGNGSDGNHPRVAQLQAHPGMEDYRVIIMKAAADNGLDSALLGAVIAIESGFRKDARSPRGAVGLMQLMPRTAAALVDVRDLETALVDPATNVGAGSRHLRRLIDQYPGRLDLALAAYNAGEGAVEKYDDVPPYAETRQYVRDVIALYARYKADK
jgi:soluble lytic murein transglycosylase-like protein